MDRCVQVVDQLGADGGLGQHQLNRGERIAGIAVEHRKERLVGFGRLEALLFYRRRTALRQPLQRFDGALQEFADLSPRLTAFVARADPAPRRPA